MARVAITNLTSGEISPTMLGRADVQRYGNGCQVLENYLLTATGMWSYRPGFRLMGLTKFQDRRCILRRFQFSDQQGYILEIGHFYFRIWHTSGQIVSGGPPAPVEVVTQFSEDDLDALGFAQSADFLFVAHETKGLWVIKRLTHESWAYDGFTPLDGPYDLVNADAAKTVTFDALSGTNIQCTFAGVAPFGAGDENRHIRVKDGSLWRWLIVHTVDSASVVHAELIGTPFTTITIGVPVVDWRLGLWSNRLGWPNIARLHQQRLVLAGSTVAPDRIDGSKISDFRTFSPDINDDDAYAYALGTEGVNRIIGLAIAKELILYTVGTTHRVAGDSAGASITPTRIWQEPIDTDGAKRIEPLPIGSSIVSVDKAGLSIRARSFEIRYQGYAAENLTLLADHMAFPDENSAGFGALAWQANPLLNIWTIRGNGQLAGCLYAPQEQVLGWHRHPMGMPDGAASEPVVEAIDTMKGTTHDELWAAVRRDLPTGTLRTIERMDRPDLWFAPPESQMHLDCGLSLRNTPTATLTPASTSGGGVLFNLSAVTGGFAFTTSHVGQFLKYRYISGYTRRRKPKYATAIAKITARNSDTQVVADILVAFPSTAGIPASSWGLTVSRITGLNHFIGLGVWIVSDGRVFGPRTVDALGGVDLDVPGWELHAGCRYEGYCVPMPVDPGPSPAVGQGRQQRVDRLLLRVLNSVGGEVMALPATEEEPERWTPVIPYNQGQAAPQAPPRAVSKDHELITAGAWTRRAEVAIRQTQPLPFNCSLIIEHNYAPWVQP